MFYPLAPRKRGEGGVRGGNNVLDESPLTLPLSPFQVEREFVRRIF